MQLLETAREKANEMHQEIVEFRERALKDVVIAVHDKAVEAIDERFQVDGEDGEQPVIQLSEEATDCEAKMARLVLTSELQRFPSKTHLEQLSLLALELRRAERFVANGSLRGNTWASNPELDPLYKLFVSERPSVTITREGTRRVTNNGSRDATDEELLAWWGDLLEHQVEWLGMWLTAEALADAFREESRVVIGLAKLTAKALGDESAWLEVLGFLTEAVGAEFDEIFPKWWTDEVDTDLAGPVSWPEGEDKPWYVEPSNLRPGVPWFINTACDAAEFLGFAWGDALHAETVAPWLALALHSETLPAGLPLATNPRLPPELTSLLAQVPEEAFPELAELLAGWVAEHQQGEEEDG